jgi:hypothetical protein
MRSLAYDQKLYGRNGQRIPHPCTLALDGEDDFAEIDDFVGQLSRVQQRALLELLADTREQTGDRRRRRAAHDEPERFPGRPRPGGGQDPLGAAHNERGGLSFAERFPETAHIRGGR